MVKIKEGSVMSPRERAEYERQDALAPQNFGTCVTTISSHKPSTRHAFTFL